MPRPRKPDGPFRYFNSSPEVIRLAVLLFAGDIRRQRVSGMRTRHIPSCDRSERPPVRVRVRLRPIVDMEKVSRIARMLIAFACAMFSTALAGAFLLGCSPSENGKEAALETADFFSGTCFKAC